MKTHRSETNLPNSTPKDRIMRAVRALPDDATLNDAIERLIFLRKIEVGLEQAESGQTVSFDRVESDVLRRRELPRRSSRGQHYESGDRLLKVPQARVVYDKCMLILKL